MKKKLNILCLLVIVVLALSAVESISSFFTGMRWGYDAAALTGQQAQKDGYSPVFDFGPVFWNPESLQGTAFTVYNEKTGCEVDIWPIDAFVAIDKQMSQWMYIVSLAMSMGVLIFTIWAVAQFVKLIRCIDHQEVFSWPNVKRLRKLGWVLTCAYFCEAVYYLIEFYGISRVLEVQGYSLNYWRIFSSLSFLLGIISFVVAEVFAIGLRVKEEQELTI